jgi:hypothetical protein
LPPSRPAVPAPVERSAEPVEAAQKSGAPVTATPAPLPDTPPSNITPLDRAAEEARPAGNPDAAVAAPIPLLPLAGAAEVEKAALPAAKPGPGSGGLY